MTIEIDFGNGRSATLDEVREAVTLARRRRDREAAIVLVKAVAGGLLALASIFVTFWILWSQPIEQSIQRFLWHLR